MQPPSFVGCPITVGHLLPKAVGGFHSDRGLLKLRASLGITRRGSIDTVRHCVHYTGAYVNPVAQCH